MIFGADYPFLSVLWTLLVIFAWVIWFWLLITVFADLFRRHDIGGGKKALWIIFVILVPFVGVLIYLIANSHAMAERNEKQMRQTQAQTDAYIRSVAATEGPTAEIERAKGLLDTGAISQSEFDAIKAKALSG